MCSVVCVCVGLEMRECENKSREFLLTETLRSRGEFR